MKTINHPRTHQEPRLQRLEDVVKPFVGTRACAYYLDRSVGTLHKWSTTGDGLLRPTRIGKRLAWSVADIRAVLGA